ncbi:Zinc finger protein 831 [Larimichthys crocea]|uniref:Uncharacterized protein n=1 Tax=Larimichthys crocea TaxID=215358 RepID=A0ACD3RJN2_LARCR|nr:Zinc finger protein 831 [Larimichthys crocea]
MSSSRETCTSSLSLDERSEESGSIEKDSTLPAAEITCPASTATVYSVKTDCSVRGQIDLTSADYNTKEKNESGKVTTDAEKQRTESKKPQLTASRHLPLQRQEATLFSKQWESSVSRGKSQSHESTDSGFSESSDHYPSPGSVLPDHSMDSLTESTKEHLEETISTETQSEPGQGAQEPKDSAREQEHKTLEERISKLISENTAVVEDKQLENVRPRKTVLSKQGSIDLPMPYTYKDSFHFDMKISKPPNVGLQRNRKSGIYSSVPTQRSTTMEHAPLTRSNSLPFSVTLMQPERSSPTFSYQNDYVTLVRRGSSGQINPTGFAIKPVNQQSSTHRSLVRQTAVDCNHATDGLFMNSSVEEACTSSLSCDGDGGDICGEPSNRKFRRKKAQKFAYNKWYMYGGGTFKKLYNADKGGDESVIKGRKSTNPEHETVQGLQKRLSAVHKETVTTTNSTINFTSSSATVCHSDCPPAKLPLVSPVDLNLKTSQLHTACSSLKSPFRRNLSLSILPLPLIGSVVSHTTDSMSRADDGRLINEEKHSDSSSQPHGAHIPSDRKKQKTDDKIICPLEMETERNTLTHPPPSVTGSAPLQDTNLSYINLQKNLKHTQLKGALFPSCIINANTPSVSTTPATSTPSAAKTSFLPKYQLKLPSTAEPESNPSAHVVDTPSGTDGRSFTSALSSSHTEQTPIVVTTSDKKSDPVCSPLMPTDVKKTNAFSSTQSQLLLPCTTATLCQTETPSMNKIASLDVVHRQFATTTVTTTCLRDFQAGLCSTSIQSSKSAGASEFMQLQRPNVPVVANLPATPTITTANKYQTSSTTITALSQAQPNPPLSYTQLSPASNQLNPVNRPYPGSNTPVVPYHIVPFDQMQPVAQNVFHVHTADLQICLQIISDEQLALIEPQIERQAGRTLSQRHGMEAVAPEVIQNKAQSSITMESTNEGRDHHQPGQLDRSETLPTLTIEKIKPPLDVQFGKPNLPMTGCSDSTQATVSVESKPPEALGLSQRLHKYGHVNTVTDITRNVMSTAASLKGVKSGRSQTSEEAHALSLNHCAEEQLLPDRRVSQSGLVSPTISQHELSVTSLSPSTVNQNSFKREILAKESQHKLKNQDTTCNAGTMIAKGEASAYHSSRLESAETHSPLQVGLSQASVAACADELSGSVSSSFIKAPSRLTPQASIYHSNPLEPTLSEALNSSKHANMGCDRVTLVDSSASSQEMTRSESQDIISSAHSEKQQGQVDRPKNIPAVLTSVQSPAAGLMEGDSLGGCAVQKQLQIQERGGTPEQPDAKDWRPKQSQDAGETNYQCMERQHGGEEKSKAEPNCRYTCLQEMTKPEGEDRTAKVDSFKNLCLSEQHLLGLSQTHSGMSEYLQQNPQQTPRTLNNLNLPASSSQTCLLNSPPPPLEMTNFYYSQQHWESSIIHNQQTQILCKSTSSQHVKAQAKLSETQNAFSQIESSLQQTQIFSCQDQKQTSVCLSAQQENTTAGHNVTAVSCCTQLTVGSHKILSPDIKASSPAPPSHVSYSGQVSRAAAGLTADPQVSDSNVLVNDTVLPTKPFTYPQPDDYQDTKDKASNDYIGQSSNSERSDITNKFQSFFFAGQLHGYQPAEGLTSGVGPVQSCQDYTEDTSSSDDEGKLIIEL